MRYGEEAAIGHCANHNADAYALLFELENGLRELIITEMSRVIGPQWLKRNVAGDIRDTMKKGKMLERNFRWSRASSYHPLYYADFPDLRKIICQSDNWKNVFAPSLGRKLNVESKLSELEPIRNKIAHARPVSNRDLAILQDFHAVLSSILGRPIRDVLDLAMQNYGLVSEAIVLLRQKLVELRQSMIDAVEYQSIEDLEEVLHSWWFDETFLLHSLEDIVAAVELAVQYCSLPKGRGSGYRTDKWVHEKSAVEKLDLAVHLTTQMLSESYA